MKKTRLTYIKRWSWGTKKKSLIIIALINAVVLTIGTYFINNFPLLTGENLNLYAGLEYVKRQFVSPQYVNDSVLLINVAYNKAIAEKTIDGMPVGNTDITDRQELAKLLQNLKKCQYKYIFLDVRFEDGVTTPYDKELFRIIKSMPNIVIADHSDMTLADESLKEKAAYSDYYVTITSTNFVRYQFLRSEGETMPLRAYQELNGTEMGIEEHGWVYTSNGKLCQNALVIKSPISGFNEYGDPISIGDTEGRESICQNLNRINDIESLSVLAHDKYIVIGNMIDDQHDTFFGKIPGSILVFSAFWALNNGEHIVRYSMIIFFFILYFAISLSLFSHVPVLWKIPFMRKFKSKLFRFLLTLLGYSTVLTMAVVILYLCFGCVSSILFPALFFSIQKTYINYKNI